VDARAGPLAEALTEVLDAVAEALPDSLAGTQTAAEVSVVQLLACGAAQLVLLLVLGSVGPGC